MLLEHKHALVFAATGAIGGEVARTFAREGAHVWVSGRTPAAVDALVAEIVEAGGTAVGHVVDATDPTAVDTYVKGLDRVDVVFNAIGLPPAELGYPAYSPTLDFETFLLPQRVILGSTFLTSRSAGARMVGQGSGSIVTLSASLSGTTVPWMAALTATCGAIEAMTRSLSAEFGPAGVRVNCVRGDAMAETRTIHETMAGTARLAGLPEGATVPLPPTPLGRSITVAETAATVAFLASDRASGITSQTYSVSGNALV